MYVRRNINSQAEKDVLNGKGGLHNENRNWHNRAIYSSIMRHTDVSLMTHKNDLMIVISVLQTVINAP